MIFYTTNGEFKAGCPADIWGKEVAAGCQGLGRDPHPGHKLEGWFREIGFVNIHHLHLPVPLGPWPKDKKMVSLAANNTCTRLAADMILTLESSRVIRSTLIPRRA
jgi:hypothetical protein